MAEKYKRTPNSKCYVCGKFIYRRPFEIKRSSGRVFCSSVCFGIYCRKEVPCVMCAKPILSGLNKKTCSRSCANKHRKGIEYKIHSPKDKVKNQRSLKIRLLSKRGKYCEKCKYDVYEILQVHHKDKNKDNNKLENLELICPNCHAKEHYLENSWFTNNC